MRFHKMLTAVVAAAGLLFLSPVAQAAGGASNTDTGAGRVSKQHINGGAVNPTKLSDGLLDGTYVNCLMDSQPSISAANGYGDPTGTGGDINRAQFACGLSANYIAKGTQTLLGPLLDTTGLGLDISQDQTDNDGVEYVFGANNASGRFEETVGTTTNSCLRVKLKIADVSGTDDLFIGWRKNEASQANLDDYDEMAGVNVILGQLYTETILNAGATTTTTVTGSTWVDNAVHTVEVCVRGRKAYYYYDNLPIQKSVVFNFDTAEVIGPVLFFLQATTSPGKVFLQEVEIYDQSEAEPLI